MNSEKKQALSKHSIIGFSYAVPSYFIWGLSPVLFKALSSVPAFEILMHRMIWSYLFLVPLLLYGKRWRVFINTFKAGRLIAILLVTTLILAGNWFVFIWAINHGHILETSLGYYINPLVNVLLGMVFLKERLRPFQIAAVILAGIGVLYLTIFFGSFPWIALFLALTFGSYAIIRKVAPVGALEGLAVETFLLSIPALIYLVYLTIIGAGSIFNVSIGIDLKLICTALVTGLPLLLFTIGARRLQLTTMGFLQYIAPSCTFVLAVFVYNEPFVKAQIWTFALIWAALVIFSIDAILYYKNYESRVQISSKP